MKDQHLWHLLGELFRKAEICLNVLDHWPFHVLNGLEDSLEVVVLQESIKWGVVYSLTRN